VRMLRSPRFSHLLLPRLRGRRVSERSGDRGAA
jgi:hypothetical protein